MIARPVRKGLAVGGPIDGAEIAVEAVPMMPVRGVHLVVGIGDSVDTIDWHIYALTQRVDEKTGAIVFDFAHGGVIDGNYPPCVK